MSHPQLAVRPSLFLRHPVRYDLALRDLWWRGFVDAVHDGDTYWCLFDAGRGQPAMVKIRLIGCDSPELTTAAGKDVLTAVKSLLIATPVLFRHEYTRSGAEIMSFDRYVCHVQLCRGEDRIDLTTYLITNGWATPWSRATYHQHQIAPPSPTSTGSGPASSTSETA